MNQGFSNNATSSQRFTQRMMPAVFGWMFAGLLMTAIIAGVLLQNSEAITMLRTPIIFYAVIAAEIITVIFLSKRLGKMSATAASFCFFLYAALNGLTIAAFMSRFEVGTIASAFGIAAAMFGVFAIFGAVTKKDLTKLGSLLFMLLIGVIIATLANAFFIKSGAMGLIISYVAVLIFCGLTAYDMQKIKEMGAYSSQFGEEGATKIAIFGALMLYMDFVMIFWHLLNIFGSDD
ncbi:hypothetical protein SAMN04487866_11931 [Thermoactinomyces sp. DSM 45891]|uniref:Bax inhibitor-1/YccA family protein n=1 Tax=Thermoactinomyces sp. DSM 45891 TaxID=1761907 RepID=UPI00091AF65E|nr:Bax inhibitor-1/YccA family protein [Thermoactinomyces sp. DSM 45891]SFX71219.1 hypothetical protein SAMN04487866_11931 [Thermoactinomyces sp. DSM 45891]